jgi:hypothetical protein
MIIIVIIVKLSKIVQNTYWAYIMWSDQRKNDTTSTVARAIAVADKTKRHTAATVVLALRIPDDCFPTATDCPIVYTDAYVHCSDESPCNGQRLSSIARHRVDDLFS